MRVYARSVLEKRASIPPSLIGIIVSASIIVILILLVLVRKFFISRETRRSASGASNEPKSSFSKFMRRIFPPTQYKSTLPISSNRTPSGSSRPSTDLNHELQNEEERGNNRMSRMSNNRLSVRSIASLPPYHVAPLPSERLIAREGERAGVDSVLEYPESDTELEERREEEMQALFNIRQARRREQEERTARREARRAAALRGDWQRVREIDAESRARQQNRQQSSISGISHDPARNNSSTRLETGEDSAQADSNLLIAQLQSLREHNASSRRVSSVSYADLGVARHDGTRIRADSIDSDHRPLLDSAASMGGRNDRSRASSIASGRDQSRSRATLQINQDGRPSTANSFVSQDEDGFLTPQSTIGDAPPDPPSYEDDVSVHGGEVPPYEDPARTQNPQVPTTAHTNNAGGIGRAVSPALVIHEAEDNPPPSTQAPTSVDPPQLQLNTTTILPPPVIEVVQATPIIPHPASPPIDQHRSL